MRPVTGMTSIRRLPHRPPGQGSWPPMWGRSSVDIGFPATSRNGTSTILRCRSAVGIHRARIASLVSSLLDSSAVGLARLRRAWNNYVIGLAHGSSSLPPSTRMDSGSGSAGSPYLQAHRNFGKISCREPRPSHSWCRNSWLARGRRSKIRTKKDFALTSRSGSDQGETTRRMILLASLDIFGGHPPISAWRFDRCGLSSRKAVRRTAASRASSPGISFNTPNIEYPISDTRYR